MGFVFATGAVLGAGVALWAIVEAVSADPVVAGSIVGSLAAATGAVFAVVFQQARAERDRLKEVHRARMEPIYEQFVDLSSQRFADEPQAPDADRFFLDLKRKQLLLGADLKVIQAFNAWNRTSATEDEPLAPALAYEMLLRAIRADLGHSDPRPSRGDLLRLFSDFEDGLTP
jgi:hypothetical protein